MKQVIFVGSTAYSGSTLLDLTLANDTDGFSCGEVQAFFCPTKPHHVSPNCAAFPGCSCSKRSCKVWQNIKKNGTKHIYESIFDQFPEVNFIVDSSKDPFWIAEQNDRLVAANVAVKNIAIWKSPLEIAVSFAKRKQEQKWEKSWVNYYRIYHTLLGNTWRSVRYKDFVKNSSAVEQLCSTLEIRYFSGKEQYWRKYPHYTLFGNHSARVHLNEDIGNYTEVSGEKKELLADSRHRSIYYSDDSDKLLRASVEHRIRKSKYIQSIVELLESRDTKNSHFSVVEGKKPITRSTASIIARKYKRIALNAAYRSIL